MRTHFESNTRRTDQRLADLKHKTAELERQLSAARVSLECELGQCACGQPATPGHFQETALDDVDLDLDADSIADRFAALRLPHGQRHANPAGPVHSAEERTEVLVNQGRRNAYSPRFSRGRKIAAVTAVIAVFLAIPVLLLFRGGASWPASVAIVQNEAARACQNPDVKSEPGQVNFACAKATRQILWVFAMLTSADNPDFGNAKTGRVGLEPITPAQGGEVAWSLNLHHPYDPANPIDSLEVAARAINNIVGGATLTRANGHPVVQPGLESHQANCVRYTGSPAVTSREGFPRLCARPVTSPAGQAALVSDIYQKWVVGAAPADAQDAAVLFENANNPGNPRVQAILKHLSNSKPSA